jgi:hypothetical protein
MARALADLQSYNAPGRISEDPASQAAPPRMTREVAGLQSFNAPGRIVETEETAVRTQEGVGWVPRSS